jgi:hypothetical protein
LVFLWVFMVCYFVIERINVVFDHAVFVVLHSLDS